MKATESTPHIGIIITAVEKKTSGLFLSHLIAILDRICQANVTLAGGNIDVMDYGGPSVYSIKHRKMSNALARILNYIYLQTKISYRVLKLGNKVDLWLFFMGEGLLLPMLVAKSLRKKVMLLLAGFLEKEGEMGGDVLYKPLALLKKINLALSNQLVVYSPNLIEQWELEKYRHKISIAPRHFLDFDKFKVERKFDERDNLIGYIGVLSKAKGVPNLLEAISKVLSSENEAKFLIGGDGKLRGEVEEFSNKENLSAKVKFAGWIPHHELPEYLNELKLLVLPSYTEGLPNIMLEAMACGTPVLATPVGGVPDVINDGETGFIMEDNSPESIAENVIRALNHPDFEEIARNARALVEREFTFEKAVERYRSILDTALE